MSISLQDIKTPIDPTAYTSISGAQLLQILSSLTPAVNTGMCLITQDINGNPTVPDARTDSSATSTKWQRYLWIRISATSVGVYVWNPSTGTDATFLQWQSINIAGIAAGSLQNFMYADNSISSVKISSLDYSKLAGAPTGLTPSGPAGGVLSGNYPNPSIATGGVTAAMIANGTIVAGNVANLTLTLAVMAPISGSAKDMARVNAGATGMEAFTPPVLFTSGVAVPTANSLKVPQVNVGATDFQMVAPTTLGRVLQIIETEDATTDNTVSNWPSNALPTTANGKHYAALDTAITPINAGSTLLIEVGVWLASAAGAGQMLVASLFQDAGVNAIGVGHVGGQGNAGSVQVAVLRLKVASGSVIARTFKAYFGATSGTTYLNGSNVGAIWGGGFPLSWMRVTEYL